MSEEVIRLFTFFLSVAAFAAFVWFGITVELGERTLFGHLRAIGGTREAQQLYDGARAKVTDLVGIEAARKAEADKRAADKRKDDDAGGNDDAWSLPKGVPPVVHKAPEKPDEVKAAPKGAGKPVAQKPAAKPAPKAATGTGKGHKAPVAQAPGKGPKGARTAEQGKTAGAPKAAVSKGRVAPPAAALRASSEPRR